MKKKFTILITAALMLLTMMARPVTVWGQSDHSTDYTGNVTLSTDGGSNASACTIKIGDPSQDYAGIKAGTSSKTGAVKITVPANTKYLHLHAAAWNNNPTALAVTPTGYSDNIDLTANSGIANNSPFTFNGDPSTSDYYKVITFTNALAADTDLTFTATTGKRFVIWGVTAEEEGGGGSTVTATTVTIYDSGLTNTDIYQGTNAGTLTATVTENANNTTIANATVAWSSTNESVATIDQDGNVTLVAVGNATLKATYAGLENTYGSSSANYQITVTNSDPNVPGTENNPYTVAQARAAIDAGTGVTGVYATGIVSAIPTAWSTQYNNITFNFVDNAGDTDFLQAFRCVSGTGVDASEVAVGDIVVVYGNLTKYGTTYEFGQGCQLVSLTHPAVTVETPTFSPVAGTYADAQTVTISCASPSTVIYYTLDGTEPTDASTLYSGAISVSTTTTIKAVAYAGGSDHSTVASANYYICSADDPYTVTEALAFEEYQYPANGIYVEGIVSTAPTAAPTSNGELTYYISVDGDATNQLEVYKGKGLNEATFTAQDDIQVGDIVTVYGNVVYYGTTLEFASGNYLVSFERPSAPAVPTITVTPALVEATSAEKEGNLAITLENIVITETGGGGFDYVICDAEGAALSDPSTVEAWLALDFPYENNAFSVYYVISENTTTTARTAYFKVYGLGDDGSTEAYSNLITVTQAAYVAPPTPGNNYVKVTSTTDLTDGQYLIVYEDGNVAFDGGLDSFDKVENTIAVTIENNAIASTTTTDAAAFTIASMAEGYSIQGTSGKYITVTSYANGLATSDEAAANGIDFENGNVLITVAFTGGTMTLKYNDASNQLRFRYYKSGQKDIQLYKKVVDPTAPSITVTPNSIAAESTGTSGTLGITLANMTISDVENQMSADFFTATGEPITGGKPDWIEFEFHLNGGAYSATYTIANNTTTSERNAYFKVYGLDDDATTEAYSNLVSVTQEAYVAPVAAITLDSYAIDATASETNGTLTVTLENMTISDVGQFSIDFFHQDGSDFNPGEEKPDWVHADFTLVNNVYSLNYTVDANTETTERNAYFKVYGLDDNGSTDAYSELVTVTQAGATGPVTTGTIVFGNNGTKINGTNVTGDDSMGNTWTITTEGTTSFTQNAAYSQVGSSGSPATSITFTTTLPQATTITAFEAKFGGFSGTAGDINLLVGETNVGSGALNASTDVTVTNTTTATGTVLTVTVTNIAKGVKCYYISYTVSTSTDPMINAPASIDLASDATSGEIEYSIINPTTGVNLTATTTTSWISGITVTDEKVSFTTSVNTETTERQGTITLSYTGATDKEVTVIQAAYVPPVNGQQFALFGGNLVEGDYIIYYNGKAMNNVVSSGRLQYAEIEPEDNVITTDNAAIVWHIALNDEGYWTIYSADANAYAASTGVKNKAQLLDDGTDDMAMWTVTEISGTYEFVNKANAAGDVNANLRNNGTYGFACYATSTGGALSLYKYTTETVVTYTKEIAGYGNNAGGYYLIASPVLAVAPAADNGFLTDAYDLYYFDQNEAQEWRNYEKTPFNLAACKGYLYASKENTTLTFTGVPYSGNGEVTLSYDASTEFEGWNLIGNPFATAATLNMPFYKMNAAGDGFTPKIEDLSNTISAMEGVFVQATAANQTATFTPQTSKSGRQSGIAKANLNVIGANGKVIDNAIVRFDEGQTLEKFMLHADGTNIFFTEGNKDYAIVRSNGQGETPVNFKAAENGTYTIDFSMENVEFDYLHLIDNMTGNDIDLLQTPSYTFEANHSDYAARFKLVFNANNINSTDDNFAFISDGNIIINGNGTMQVIDMMGRVIVCKDAMHCVSTNGMVPGVYVLRLIDGDNVRTQKIVVK